MDKEMAKLLCEKMVEDISRYSGTAVFKGEIFEQPTRYRLRIVSGVSMFFFATTVSRSGLGDAVRESSRVLNDLARAYFEFENNQNIDLGELRYGEDIQSDE